MQTSDTSASFSGVDFAYNEINAIKTYIIMNTKYTDIYAFDHKSKSHYENVIILVVISTWMVEKMVG